MVTLQLNYYMISHPSFGHVCMGIRGMIRVEEGFGGGVLVVGSGVVVEMAIMMVFMPRMT